MAVTSSGLFVTTWMDILDSTQLAVQLDHASNNKVAMFSNSITPNFSTDTAYGTGTYASNEVSGTGYSAGGATAVGGVVSESPTGTLKFTINNTTWNSSTITGARCALFYTVTPSNRAVCLVNFGGDYSTTAGTFTIQWAAAGMFTIDLTP